MEYFGDAEMLGLISEMESAFRASDASGAQTVLDALDTAYARQIPKTIHRVGSHIRSHAADFIKLEN